MGEGLLNAEVDLAQGTLRLDVPDASVDWLVSIENVVTGAGDDTVAAATTAPTCSMSVTACNIAYGGGGDDTDPRRAVPGPPTATPGLTSTSSSVRTEMISSTVVGPG